MVERKTLNLVVVGSIPTGGAYFRGGRPRGLVALGASTPALRPCGPTG
jgi:hypothetical protein